MRRCLGVGRVRRCRGELEMQVRSRRRGGAILTSLAVVGALLIPVAEKAGATGEPSVPRTVAAGIFKLPYPVFALSVAVSSAAWIAVFLFLGVTVGGHVAQALRAYRQAAVLIGIAALLVAVVVVIFRFDRSKRAPRRLDSTP